MTEIAISVKNVSKCYRAFDDQRSRLMHAVWPRHTKGMQEVWALKDINFEIKRGEAVAIIGRNGGGKSTLLEILTGTLTPTTGQVTVNGRVSALLELGSGFNPEYSGRDNVILNGLLLGLTKDDILSRFGEIEAFAEIGAAIDRPVKTYSSGMMMRLAFAVQVLCDPDILIIDEALSVGDFFFQQKCLSYIKGLSAKGVTLLFVSHDMGTVREICKRGIFLKNGHVPYDGGQNEAIRLYLGGGISGLKKNNQSEMNSIEHRERSFDVLNPVWENQCGISSAPIDKQAELLAVGLYDENENPTDFLQIGDWAKIKVSFKSFDRNPIHVYVALKNKYDQVITGQGSYSMKIDPPVLKSGQCAVFNLSLQLSLEAGSYSFSINLVQPSHDGMSGTVLDETPWLGPIQVRWDYEKDIPPFYGIAGLNCNGGFTV